MTVLKAIAKRNSDVPCQASHATPVPARWEVDIAFAGRVSLCSAHYRTLTEWECENCERPNYGMTWRCQCGWVRPDTCRKCGQVSTEPLIKIVERRGGHPCHDCGGNGKAKGFVSCPKCNGSVRTGGHMCFACLGTGRDLEKKTPCKSCDGLGKTTSICSTCKGTGEILGRTEGRCPSCEGDGRCYHSSARWNLDRIALTDIHPEHQEKLREYIGQYLCFRCANPDFQFSPYRESDEPLQCFHYEEVGEGEDPVRCTNPIARSNSSEFFCFKHSKAHICEVCGHRLKLDEWGRRCREHARCARCDEKPLADSLFCQAHQSYKALGKIMEKQRVPETPLQILKAQEGVERAIEGMARRRDESRRRAQENTLRQRQAEQELYEVLIHDPPENEERRLKAERKRIEISKLNPEIEEEARRATELQEEVRSIEQEMEAARTPGNRVQIKALREKIQQLEKYIEEDLAVFVRYRRTGTELDQLLLRLEELRHYELWDRKSTPECFGEPEWVQCWNCGDPFNAKATHWICPHCTTEETIPVADGRRYKRADDIVAVVCLPTDNRPQLEHELDLTCEVCGRKVPSVSIVQLYRPDKFSAGGVSQKAAYAACSECRNESPEYLVKQERKRLKRIEDRREEDLQKRIADLHEKHLREERELQRENDFRQRYGFPLRVPSVPVCQAGIKMPVPISIQTPAKPSRDGESDRRYGQARRAAKRYAAIISKDLLTTEDREELRKLLPILEDAKKEFGILVKQRRAVVEKPVPPPPPSRWTRK